MNLPTVMAQAAPDALREWWPFILAAAGIIGTWGESRVHISGLRETVKTQEAKINALETRCAAAEVREGRTMERLDYFAARLDRIDGKLDRIDGKLDQHRNIA